MVCTVMSTTPAAAAGAVTVRLVAVAAVTVPATVPNFTLSLAIVVSNPVPVIVTAVPPMVGPAVGEMESMAGAGAAASATTGMAQAKNTAKNMRQI